MEAVKLKNGIKLLLKPQREWPVVAGSFFFPVGCAHDSVEGITLLTLRTAFKGSLRRSPKEFAELQERMGSPFVPDISCDYSFVKFQAVSSKFPDYLSLLKEVIESPNFREESFQVEKASLLASIRSKKESPFALAYEEIMKTSYSGTPYSKLPYGSLESVNSLELNAVKDWFNKNFLPKGSVLSLCGDLRGLDRVAELLSALKTVESPAFEFNCPIGKDEERVIKREGSEQSFIMVALNAPSVREDSYPAYKLLNTLLGEGIGSLLFQELREKRGYAYSTGSIFPSRLNTARLLAYIGTSPHKEEEVKGELLSLLKELPEFITPQRVKRAKEYFRGTYLLDHELRAKKAWYYGFWQILKKGWSYDGEFIEEVLSTEVDEVRRVAEELSASPKLVVVVKDEG